MSTIAMSGNLSAKLIKMKKAPLIWTLRNVVRWEYVWGLITTKLAKTMSLITGVPVLTSELHIMHKHNGEWRDYGVVGRRCVTTAGVGWLVDCIQGTYEPEIMKYHGCGTGTTAAVIGDTALETESTAAGVISAALCTGGAYRPAGTLAEGASANIFSTVATIGFDGDANITEHGLFTAASAGVLWDRTVFAAIAVSNTDTIAFTYQLTLTAGG